VPTGRLKLHGITSREEEMTEANLMESERFKMGLVIVGGDGDDDDDDRRKFDFPNQSSCTGCGREMGDYNNNSVQIN
jgi:hypothetical protein